MALLLLEVFAFCGSTPTTFLVKRFLFLHIIMATIAASRIAALNRLRCSIFQTSYNPESIRTGAKYLRARLKGPSLINYYPEEVNMSTFGKGFPDVGFVDLDEEQRLQDIIDKKKRGKGTPRKARTPRKHDFVFLLRRVLTIHYRGEPQKQEATIDSVITFIALVHALLYHIISLITLSTSYSTKTKMCYPS